MMAAAIVSPEIRACGWIHNWIVTFEELKERQENGKELWLRNLTGSWQFDLIEHKDYAGEMIDMRSDGELVTLSHLFLHEGLWIVAEKKFASSPRVQFAGSVFNLHIRSENLTNAHYVLGNGEIAHNAKLL